jgi:hypothetical protein
MLRRLPLRSCMRPALAGTDALWPDDECRSGIDLERRGRRRALAGLGIRIAVGELPGGRCQRRTREVGRGDDHAGAESMVQKLVHIVVAVDQAIGRRAILGNGQLQRHVAKDCDDISLRPCTHRSTVASAGHDSMGWPGTPLMHSAERGKADMPNRFSKDACCGNRVRSDSKRQQGGVMLKSD